MEKIKIKRTQVWFDESRLERKKYTGLTWQELVELGIEYREYLISIGDAEPSGEVPRPKDFMQQIRED